MVRSILLKFWWQARWCKHGLPCRQKCADINDQLQGAKRAHVAPFNSGTLK